MTRAEILTALRKAGVRPEGVDKGMLIAFVTECAGINYGDEALFDAYIWFARGYVIGKDHGKHI